MNVGENIRSVRKQKKLTQEQLADKIGVKRSVVSKYENDCVKISVETLEKIAKALDVDIFDIYIGSDWYNYNHEEDNEERAKINKSIVDLIVQAEEEEVQKQRMDTIQKYDSLNKKGQKKANGYITDLTQIDEYTATDEAVPTDEDDE